MSTQTKHTDKSLGTEEEQKPSLVKNILTIFAFIIIVIVGVWGAVNVVRLAPSLFSALISPFSKSDTELLLSAPEEAKSGTLVTVSWEHTARDDGFYTFSYGCRPNVAFVTPTANDTETPLACDTPYTISAEDEKQIRIMPRSTVVQTEVTLAVSYTDEDEDVIAEGTAAMTILNPTVSPGDGGENGDGTSGEPKPPQVSAPDLRVRIINFGILDPNTRAFIPQSIVRPTDTAAVRFEVANIGSRGTGGWLFTATLPTEPARSYSSTLQQSLNPGDRIEYTLSFSNITTGGGTFRITADPSNQVAEANENNNTVIYTASPVSGY
jgi:hypothetical protein